MAFSNRVVNGTDVKIYIGNDLVGCATSHSIERSTSVREVACKDTGNWMGKEYGRNSWTASIEALQNPYVESGKFKYIDFVSMFQQGTKVQVKSSIVDPENGDKIEFIGSGVIASISDTYGDAENATYSISIEGNGELAQVGVDYFETSIATSGFTGGADYVAITGFDVNKIIELDAAGAAKVVLKGSGTNSYEFTAFNGTEIHSLSQPVTATGTVTINKP